MDVTRAIPSHVGPTSFAFLTTDEIKRISVRQISNPELLDNTNNPNAGGLYDPALGPMRRDDICGTCHQNSFRCPGHFGHIQLPSPVFHPLFMPQMYTLLRGVCLYCHRFKVEEVFAIRVVAQLRLLDYGLVEAAEDVGRDMPQYDEKQSADESLGTQGNMMDLEAREGTDDEDGGGVSGFVFDKDTKKESPMQFQQRITAKVQRLIRDAVRKGARRNADSTGAAYTARKAVVSRFTKQITMKDNCPHCLVVNPRLRKDGFVKIVERMLSEQNELRNEARGFHRLNLTQLMSKKAKRETSKQTSPGENNGADDEITVAHAVVSGAVKEKLKEAMKASKKQSTETRVMPPFECRANLRMAFERERVLCNLIFGRHGLASADVFFMDVVSVSPTRFRPAAMMGDQTIENAQNELLSKVLRTCIDIRGLNETLLLLNSKGSGERSTQERVKAGDALMGAMIQLQQDVNCFIDSSKAPASGAVQPTPGVKQALEKKEGLFRKHMMGKRVNFAARSVISPDVNIETNEIGVPPVFAQKLTFNEPVTVHNIERMRRLVINGPDAYPGAVAVRNENGYETLLGPLSVEQRTALANQLLTPQEHTSRQTKGTFAGLGKSTATPPANKQVLRHLIDGDILILNRQPTLHKASMMAHRARVLKGERTIRMHYANCNSYNADFDGDEMNMHFPQSQAARAESCLIANNDNQYLVPTSGNPLRGLIQDHVVAGVWMTSKATLYTREEYQQMLYGALRPEDDYSGNGRVHTVPPAIWKPKPLWTGKQVITTVLLNLRPIGSEGLNMTSKSKVNGKLWGKGHEQEGTVIFRNGELLTGILDKAQFGASAYGLVHAVYEAYGADTAGKLLSVLSRLFTKWLQVNAFTCRMDDLLLSAKGDEARREMLKTAGKLGRAAALQTVGLPKDSKDEYSLHVRLEEVLRDDGKAAALDSGMLGAARNLRTEIIAEVLPGGQHRVFPENNFEMMVSSGAKGSLVNFSQISALLGAQELEGRRVPVMVSGKTLPSFKPFDTSLRAAGFVSGRFLTGIRPQEYYFHCMSGREGLIDTAVKTSRSGYLQRCLIKHLEGITVHYDNTVRNSDGTVVQFLYGEDGLDVTKSKYLDQLDFTAENFATFKRRYDPSQLMGVTNEDEAAQYAKKALKKPHKFAPVTSVYNPATYLGSTSETFAAQLQSYIDSDPLKILAARKKDKKKLRNEGVPPPKIEDVREKIERESFRVMNHVLYHRGLVDPGEGVGLVAAQSVGEPSTQMTLNTFHLAGHGAANVTLGIPRLREIVMTASQSIKTPIMKLPVLDGVTQEQKTLFCKDGSRLLLSQVVQNAVVEEKISAKSISTDFHRVKSYSVWLHLFPIAECQEEYNVGVSEILRGIEMTFARILEREILKELRRLTRDRLQQMHSIGHGERYTQDGKPAAAEAEEDGGEADDASGGKRGGKGGNAKAAVQAKTSAARAADDSDDEEGGGDDADEGGDGDADDAKRKRRSGAQVSYEEDGDDSSDDGAGGDAQPDTEESIDAAFAARKSRKRTAEEDEEARTAIAEQVLELEAKLQETCKYITAFEFDQKKNKWVRMELQLPRTDDKLLLISVVERACRMSVVHEVPHVGRMLCPAEPDADGMPDPNADYRLTAEGINLPGIWDFADGIVDMDNIYTNDIGAMLHTYGVEAARGAIVAEMRAIFDTYGINVSARHLQLISDYQTSMGGFLPFSRGGLAHAPSPLLKASYEMTMAFIAQAALYGEQDDMQGPSANIVVGRPIKGGTGLPQIITSIA